MVAGLKEEETDEEQEKLEKNSLARNALEPILQFNFFTLYS